MLGCPCIWMAKEKIFNANIKDYMFPLFIGSRDRVNLLLKILSRDAFFKSKYKTERDSIFGRL